MTEIGLYVHVPFCATKCGYCDFYSAVPGAGAFEPLVTALLTELDTVLAAGHRVATIFVGGGTPTLLPSRQLQRLFQRLGEIVREHRTVEFTVETNPASLIEASAQSLRAAGVNRISMGAQSFNAYELRILERIHKPEDIAAGAAIIHRTGFEHFNLDLIFGIPGQTLETWIDSIRKAVQLGPDHLACYGLTFAPGTPLFGRMRAGTILPADEELEAELYLATLETLAAAGFEHYEISNFARSGGRCQHNLRYWYNQPGIGIGPSAASYLNGFRWRNVPDTAEYIRRISAGESPAVDEERLPPIAAAGESAMLQLRLIEGIDRHRFHESTGFEPLQLFADPIARHVSGGLLQADARHIALTRKGLLLANAVISDFLMPTVI